jgi:DNA-binding XRE family transcriptional regulator
MKPRTSWYAPDRIAAHRKNRDGEIADKERLLAEWRKGSFLRPFCHLVITGIRRDSHPFIQSKERLAQALSAYRTAHGLSSDALAAKAGVSEGTIKNWERGRTTLAARLLPKLKFLISASDATG